MSETPPSETKILFVKPNVLQRLKVINCLIECAEKWLEQLEEVPTDPNRDELLALMKLMNGITGLQLHGLRLAKKVTREMDVAYKIEGQTTPMEPILRVESERSDERWRA